MTVLPLGMCLFTVLTLVTITSSNELVIGCKLDDNLDDIIELV